LLSSLAQGIVSQLRDAIVVNVFRMTVSMRFGGHIRPERNCKLSDRVFGIPEIFLA
jgi:hypothetical protein